jgi:hypothetical protein
VQRAVLVVAVTTLLVAAVEQRGERRRRHHVLVAAGHPAQARLGPAGQRRLRRQAAAGAAGVQPAHLTGGHGLELHGAELGFQLVGLAQRRVDLAGRDGRRRLPPGGHHRRRRRAPQVAPLQAPGLVGQLHDQVVAAAVELGGLQTVERRLDGVEPALVLGQVDPADHGVGHLTGIDAGRHRQHHRLTGQPRQHRAHAAVLGQLPPGGEPPVGALAHPPDGPHLPRARPDEVPDHRSGGRAHQRPSPFTSATQVRWE